MDKTPAPSPSSFQQTTLKLTLDWRLVSGVLVVAIGVMLYFWQPWHTAATKTITIRGQATVQHAPDQFTFYATYQDDNKDSLTAKGNAVVAKLKELGVKTANIKTNVAGGYGGKELLIYPRPNTTSSYSITATVSTETLAQKVTDYLATTDATGEITPQTGFTKATAAKLDLQARKEASTDAKTKAEVVAGQFGAKLGRVTKISEDTGYAYPLTAQAEGSAASDIAKATAPTLQPGTDEVSYSFTVVFELR